MLVISSGKRLCALALVLVLACVSSGCYVMFDGLDRRDVRSAGPPESLVTTRQGRVRTIEAVTQGTGLVLTARDDLVCAEVETSTRKVTITENRSLPWHYWLTSAAVVGGLGFGIYEIQQGLEDGAPLEGVELGFPDQELARDEARSRKGRGIIATALLALPALFLAGDLVAAVDREWKVDYDVEDRVLGETACGSVPVAIRLTISQGGRRVFATTGDDGQVRLPGGELGFLGVSKDPLIISAEGAREFVLENDPDWLAGWVVEHGQKGMAERFVAVFAGSPAAQRLASMIEDRRARTVAKERAAAGRALEEAQREMNRQKYEDVLDSLATCLSKDPGNLQCQGLLTQLVGKMKGRSWDDELLYEAVDLCMRHHRDPLCMRVDARMSADEERQTLRDEASEGWHKTIIGYDINDHEDEDHPFYSYLLLNSAWKNGRLAPWLKARIKGRWKSKALSFCAFKRRSLKSYGAAGWRDAAQHFCEFDDGESIHLDYGLLDDDLAEALDDEGEINISPGECLRLLTNPTCG